MKKKILILYILNFLILEFAWSQQAVGHCVLKLNPKVHVDSLENGLKFYILPNKKPANQVELRLIINAGSVLEEPDQRGMAHFLEHMAFNGSEHFHKNSMIKYLESIGIAFGADLNAYTDFNETVFMIPLPNNNEEVLHKGFLILSDILSGLNLYEKDIDSERAIINEEWRTTTGLAQRKKKAIYPLIYYNSRYLSRLPIGEPSVFNKRGNAERLRAFYKDWYRPNLSSILVVGDIDINNTINQIKNNFASIKNPINQKERVQYDIPDHKDTFTLIFKDKEITGTSIQIIKKVPKNVTNTYEGLTTEICDYLLTYMFNERLSNISDRVDAPFKYAQSYLKPGPAHFDMQTTIISIKKGKLLEGITGIQNEILRLLKYGFTDNELEVKKNIISSRLDNLLNENQTFNSSQLMSALMRHIINGSTFMSTKATVEISRKILKAIDNEDIQLLISNYFNQSEVNKVIIAQAPEYVEVPNEKDLLKAFKSPELSKISPYKNIVARGELLDNIPTSGEIISKTYDSILDVQTILFSNGVTVTLKSTTYKNDEVLVSALRKGGYSRAITGNFNNARMAAVFSKSGGLGKFSEQELNILLSDKHVSGSTYINRFYEGFSGFSSKKDIETLLKIIYLSFTNPKKSHDKIQVIKQNRIENATMAFNNPNTFFNNSVINHMSQSNPRSLKMMSPEEIEKLNTDKACAYYKERFSNARHMHFILVGNFDTPAIIPLLSIYLGSLPALDNQEEAFIDWNIKPPKPPKVFEYKKNSAYKTKALLRISKPYDFTQKKRLALYMLTDILTLKLTEIIREELGGAYSPYASLNTANAPYSHFELDINFICHPDNYDKIKDTIINIFDQLKSSIDDSDLIKIKNNYLKDRKKMMSTNQYWINLWKNMYFRNETSEVFQNYELDINSISTTDIMLVAKKILHKKDLLTFILSPDKKQTSE